MPTDNSILYRQIQGALKQCILSHGPVTKKWVSSATKRIIGNLKKLEEISYPDELLKEKILDFMARQHYHLELNRKKLKKTQDGNKKAHIAGRISETRRLLLFLDNILKKNFGPDAKVLTDNQRSREEEQISGIGRPFVCSKQS